MMDDGSSSDPEARHGGRCRLTMFTKQVSGPLDRRHSPSWPSRPGRSSELEERPGHGSTQVFCAVQTPRHPLGTRNEGGSVEGTSSAGLFIEYGGPRDPDRSS
jgi:hypothetical protein